MATNDKESKKTKKSKKEKSWDREIASNKDQQLELLQKQLDSLYQDMKVKWEEELVERARKMDEREKELAELESKINLIENEYEKRVKEETKRKDQKKAQKRQEEEMKKAREEMERIKKLQSMSGLLAKQGHTRKNWKIRWFVIKEGSLYYCSQTNFSDVKGFINLRVTVQTEPDMDGRKNCFRITPADRKRFKILLCSALTEEDRSLWIEAITLASSQAPSVNSAIS
mmetsp:Transcript_27853/g.39242  ORF Transcript_27853/g.39242 Transcript_27853/m.39242 type:complete len:228 (+) Transcript_27853:120-803(+)